MAKWNWPKSVNSSMRKLLGLLIFAVTLLVGLFLWYFINLQINPATGRNQHIGLTPQEEILKGLQSAPQMAAEFGGLYQDVNARKRVKAAGNKLAAVAEAGRSPYKFDFHVLADTSIINAFAVPGGQIFITAGLLNKLKTDDQLAAVLGHEIGHVIGRHATEQMSKWDLLPELTHADSLKREDDSATDTESYITNLINLHYESIDEQESDDLGIKFMIQSGYNPNAFPEVIRILEKEPSRPAGFLKMHAGSANRFEKMREAIAKYQKTGKSPKHKR